MEETARIAVVGAGWWACEFHIPHVLQNPNAELVSAVRLGVEELNHIKNRFNIPHVTENHRDVYSQNPNGVLCHRRTHSTLNMRKLRWRTGAMFWWKSLW